jgi:hypothetical protein
VRSNKSYTVILALLSISFLAETASAQLGPKRRELDDKSEVEIVITVRAAADTSVDELYSAILTSISQLPLDGTAAVPVGQARSARVANREVKVAVTVSPAGNGPDEQQLSQDFAAAGLRATTLLREWQQSIASTIRVGLLPCESCIAADRNQAGDAMRTATLLAANDADAAALQELLNLSQALQQWSDALVEDSKNAELGRYYTSPTALGDDPLFQKGAKCASFLIPMLASERLEEDSSCQ